MRTLILFTTALTVSLDSFICGLSLSIKTKESFKIIFGISFSVFVVCMIGSFVGSKLYSSLSQFGELIGGIILIAISLSGINGKTPKLSLLRKPKSNTLLQSILIGLAIGFDGAVGCISLSLMGYNSLTIPVFITITHILLMNFAIMVANTRPAKFFKKYASLPYFILFVLGLYKLSAFLL